MPNPLLPHQHHLMRGLDRFAAGDAQSGLLVAPTGAGKTRVLATWLAARAKAGDRVLWLAHRRTLLSQAAAELSRVTGSAVPVVTGAELSAPRAAILVAGVASVHARPMALRRWLRGGRTWLVIDEAHHAPARTFRGIIETATRAGARVVGATATPTRTKPSERGVLAALFGGTVIAEVSVQPLVEASVLARATLVRVGTGTIADANATSSELRRLLRSGDLTASWLRRLADIAPRNDVVVRHLVERRQEYGPTIVFAHDVVHAALLTRQLSARGFRADYATAERPDGAKRSIADVVASFNKGALDVIVGVDGLDEGVDLVRARTAMLVRPTRSEIRLRQSIGRVLRGPALGGDEVAYVVVLEDQWRRVAGFHSALTLVRDLVDLPDNAALVRARGGPPEERPTLDVLERASSILAGDEEGDPAALEAIPIARIVTTVRGVSAIIPISEPQLPGWQNAVAFVAAARVRDLRAADPEEMLATFFPAMDDAPTPPVTDVASVVAHGLEHREAPRIEPLAGAASPVSLARLIRDRDLGELARSQLLQDAFHAGSTPLVFASLHDLRASVDAVLARSMTP